MAWSVPTEDLEDPRRARRAISNICVSEDTRFLIRGFGGPDEVFFDHNEPIYKVVTYDGAMSTISNWFNLGRKITEIRLIAS